MEETFTLFCSKVITMQISCFGRFPFALNCGALNHFIHDVHICGQLNSQCSSGDQVGIFIWGHFNLGTFLNIQHI